MTNYNLLKTVHIISATLLFGTGLGTYFFMLRAVRSRNPQAIKVTAATVVLADWLFTTPAVVIQFVSGLLLMQRLHIAWTSPWALLVFALFCFVGALWLPVVWIQIRLRDMLAHLRPGEPLPAIFLRRARLWELLGYPAFGTMILIFALMVYKPWIS